MNPRRLAVKIGVIGLSVALALGGLQASAAENDYHELAGFPGQGIPEPGVAGAWVTPQQSGVTYMKKARQWVRTPTLQSVAFNRSTQQFVDNTCLRIPQAPGARRFREWAGDVTLVNREEALDSNRRYGFTQPFEVRTVAFGTIPVEATVALEQPRNANGVVIPTQLKQGIAEYCAGQGGFEVPPPNLGWRDMPADGSGRLRVRIDQLVVDGVKLRMAGGCMADEARLTLTSRDHLTWDPSVPDDERPGASKEQILRTRYFSLVVGGLLLGELDIPAFKGCTTTQGEDISPLLTASVSGDGNAVEIRSEALEGDTAEGGTTSFDRCPFARNCADRFPVPELPTEPPS